MLQCLKDRFFLGDPVFLYKYYDIANYRYLNFICASDNLFNIKVYTWQVYKNTYDLKMWGKCQNY